MVTRVGRLFLLFLHVVPILSIAISLMGNGKKMRGSIYEHLHDLFSHIREEFSWRHIIHTHGIVLGIAGWKILLSHIGVSFLFAKLAFVQLAVVKAAFIFGIATVFPFAHELVMATQEISPAYCGDGIINGQEQCDDGNADNGDGCDVVCLLEDVSETPPLPVERKAPAIDLYPTLSSALARSLNSFQQACHVSSDDSSILKVLANVTVEDGSIDPLHLLVSYCVIDQFDQARYGQLHNKTVTSKADALKMIAKIHAIGKEEIVFDEGGIYLGTLPYSDVYHDGRYIDYLVYLHGEGILEGVGNKNIKGDKTLNVLMPIGKQEVKTMLKNLGVSTTYSILNEPGSYVYRDEFAAILVDAFSEKFIDYAYMRGGNVAFYAKFLKQLEQKTPSTQGVYLQVLSQKLRESDPLDLIKQQNLYVDGVQKFLKLVVSEAIANKPLTPQEVSP